MTSSKFAGKQTIKLPAVCHAELPDLASPYADQEPIRLSCFAAWHEPSSGIDISEAFELMTEPGTDDWTGWSAEEGVNLAVSVEHTPSTDLFTFTLYLRIDLAVIDSVDWTNEVLPPRPPFDSGLLLSHYFPPYPQTRLQVRD